MRAVAARPLSFYRLDMNELTERDLHRALNIAATVGAEAAGP
jgi:hypothetical protein